MAKDKEEREELAVEDGDHAELRVYELGFHLDPDLPTDEAKKHYDALRTVAAGTGSIVAEGEPAKVRLAYTISRSGQEGRRDYDSAFFCWFAYETNGAGHEGVTEAAKGDASVIRFIDIRTTKDAATHSAEMAELYAKTADAEDAVEGVSDTELDAALKEVEV